jgi:peptide deformylase
MSISKFGKNNKAYVIIFAMSVRKLIQIGHPSLKKKNKKIIDFTAQSFKKLIKDLKATMYSSDLVGIAAPQIARNYTVFITHPRNTKARGTKDVDECRVFINPRVVSFSIEKSIIYEGCGSVVDGGLFGPVLRSKEIKIEAFNEKGNRFTLVADGLLARIILHELDHLNGFEFTQRIKDYSKLLDDKYYRKSIRNSLQQKKASKITKIKYKEF